MLKTEQYKLFHNSHHFDKLLNISIPEISKTGEFDSIYKGMIKQALNTNLCFLLYKNDLVIGYEVCALMNGIIIGGFTFILPDYRGNGYSYLLRQRMWALIREKIGPKTIKCFIRDDNKSSLISAQKTAQKMGFKMVEDKIVYENGISGRISGRIWKLT